MKKILFFGTLFFASMAAKADPRNMVLVNDIGFQIVADKKYVIPFIEGDRNGTCFRDKSMDEAERNDPIVQSNVFIRAHDTKAYRCQGGDFTRAVVVKYPSDDVVTFILINKDGRDIHTTATPDMLRDVSITQEDIDSVN